jgi:hypothetical protein
MWMIARELDERCGFARFEAEDVLYEFDGPRILTLRGDDGRTYLACWSDEDTDFARFVVVPASIDTVDRLRTGQLTVYEALAQDPCWVCDVPHTAAAARCYRVDFYELPRDAVPAPGVMLQPGHDTRSLQLQGRIRELDKDRLSFELRDVRGPVPSQRFVFDSPLLDAVSAAFHDDARVQVDGRASPVRRLAYAVHVSRVALPALAD